MATRDDDSRPPTGSGVHRTVRPREASTATRTVVEVSVELERMRGEMRQMGSAIREIKEDTERGFRDVGDGQRDVRDRLELVERTAETSRVTQQASMDAMRSTWQSSMGGLTDTLTSFAAVTTEKESILMDQIREDRARAREREEREEVRKAEAHALVVQRDEEDRKDAAAKLALKDQWLQRFWERFKQPMLMVMMAAAGVVIAWLGQCGGG